MEKQSEKLHGANRLRGRDPHLEAHLEARLVAIGQHMREMHVELDGAQYQVGALGADTVPPGVRHAVGRAQFALGRVEYEVGQIMARLCPRRVPSADQYRVEMSMAYRKKVKDARDLAANLTAKLAGELKRQSEQQSSVDDRAKAVMDEFRTHKAQTQREAERRRAKNLDLFNKLCKLEDLDAEAYMGKYQGPDTLKPLTRLRPEEKSGNDRFEHLGKFEGRDDDESQDQRSHEDLDEHESLEEDHELSDDSEMKRIFGNGDCLGVGFAFDMLGVSNTGSAAAEPRYARKVDHVLRNVVRDINALEEVHANLLSFTAAHVTAVRRSSSRPSISAASTAASWSRKGRASRWKAKSCPSRSVFIEGRARRARSDDGGGSGGGSGSNRKLAR
ncbi:hypothetical protein BT67DRAFT_434022 [Trichocladium antarcticum]|uniref:Uncharacterized protein n=1 Tax=Trichocladium antarcticum TaxID=1450529 RepID=A0AAN6UL09_9PEZI|nr:hypothetical protein BT67DRAFT_434022 [Trichocladium antarcticum]